MPPPSQLAVTERVPTAVDSDLPLVVLVHGSLDRSTSFTRVVRRLDDIATVVYDRRGYHRSRHALPLNTTLQGHIDDLLTVVNGRPAVVVGHSLGGDVALGAALGEGDPTKGGSILGVAAYEPPMPWLPEYSRAASGVGPRQTGRGAGESPVVGTAGTMAADGSPPPTMAADGSPPPTPVADGPAAAAERFFRRMVGDSAWERLPERARAERRADGPALDTDLRAIRLPGAPFDVSGLHVPAVFARGEISAARHRAGVEWLVHHTPDAELVEVRGAGHGAHLTHPDAFVEIVRRTVARAIHRAGDRK